MKKRFKVGIFCASSVLMYLLHTEGVIYSNELKIGIKPADSKSVNYEEIINPGESKSVPYRLVNLSDSDLNLKLELAGIKGSFEGQAEYDITQKYKILEYVKLQVDQVILKKSEKRNINLNLSVPEGSEPGEYLGGILVKDIDTGEVLGESKVNLLVNGDLKKKLEAEINISVDNDRPKSKITIKNLGNTKVEGLRVEYSLRNLKFQNYINSEKTYLYTSPITILPGDTKEIVHDIDVSLDPIGKYEAKATLNYGGIQPIIFVKHFEHTSSKKMAVFGIVMSLVFIVFVLGVFFFSRWFIRKRNHVKAVNKKWDTVVSNLIEGNAVGALNTGTIKLHDEDVTVLVNAMRKELRKTIRDEIRTLNPNPIEYSRPISEKSKKAKISSKVSTPSITSLL